MQTEMLHKALSTHETAKKDVGEDQCLIPHSLDIL